MTEEKKSMSIVDLEKKQAFIQKLRPMDDICGAIFFRDIGCAQMLLREIMSAPELEIKETATQQTLRDIFGRSVVVDALAFDKNKHIYNMEFQRSKEMAGLDRAFANYAHLVQYLIKEGAEFEDVPPISIVVIQEDDFFLSGKTVAKIKCIADGDIPKDMPSTLSVVYVNANVKNLSTPLEKMLHDLMCANPEDMLTPEFAARMRQIKHPEGKEMSNMCELLEELMEYELQRALQQGIEQGLQQGIEQGLQQGIEQSRKEERESTARRAAKSLLKQGVPFQRIEKVLSEDLSKEELLALQRDAQKELSKCR